MRYRKQKQILEKAKDSMNIELNEVQELIQKKLDEISVHDKSKRD